MSGRRAVLWLAALAVAWLVWRMLATPRTPSAPPAPMATEAPAPPTPRPRLRVRRRPAPEAGPPPALHCVPQASERCHRGDVWSFDSCDNPEEKVEECEERRCEDGLCELPPSALCDEPPEGRCDGDVVRLCLAGHPIAIDCAEKGLRCGEGAEGAECKPPIPRAERCSGPPRCEREVLVHCEDQRSVRTDCAAMRAKCLQLPGAPAPACVQIRPRDLTADCGPCGCPSDRAHAETACDGRDDDGNGLIDEGLDCGPVPVVAFIVTGADGQSSHAEEDIEAELARVNRVFARSDGRQVLSFALAQVIFLPAPEWLSIDDRELSELADHPRVHPPHADFYLPLLFTDEVLLGETPKPGVSTLPNGTCGGVQKGRGPEVGLVAVAKARYATTVAHEIGHFFGLCHTHERQDDVPLAAVADPLTGRLEACRTSCRGEGDGVCDTPFDPGPEQCAYDAECRSLCTTRADPDLTNLMSYYARCRDRFSDEQVALMQHTLALRRGWHRCLDARCACELGAEGCPAGMSCRPFVLASGERATLCDLDGPRAPRSDCRRMSDCGQGAVCLSMHEGGSKRCARACQSSRDGCDCSPVGEGLSVCLDDLR